MLVLKRRAGLGKTADEKAERLDFTPTFEMTAKCRYIQRQVRRSVPLPITALLEFPHEHPTLLVLQRPL
jgi:hypothetical protein